MKKLLDLRFVIGAFFTLVGILLLIYYFMKALEQLSAAMINAWCGAVFILFGIGMIILSYVQKIGDE